MADKVKLLYVGGPSRSGSTLLANQISRVAAVVDMGEFRRISAFASEREDRVHDVGINGNCACGAPVDTCEFWANIEKRVGLDFKTTVFDARAGLIARICFRTSALILGSRATRSLSRVIPAFARQLEAAENCWKVFDTILLQTGVQVVIDGSKQMHQFLMLRVARPESTALVCIFRSLQAVTSSAIKRPQKLRHYGAAGRELRRTGDVADQTLIRVAATRWRKVILQQLSTLALMHANRKAFLRYEDFCDDPASHVARLVEHFDLKTTPVPFNHAHSHAIGGSPSRYSQGFEKIVLQDTWEHVWNDSRESALPISAKILNYFLGYK